MKQKNAHLELGESCIANRWLFADVVLLRLSQLLLYSQVEVMHRVRLHIVRLEENGHHLHMTFSKAFFFLQKKIVVIWLKLIMFQLFFEGIFLLKILHLGDFQSFAFIFYGLDYVSRWHHNDQKSRINPVGVWWSPFLFEYNTVWLWHLMWQSTALGVASVSWDWGHWWDEIMDERGTFFCYDFLSVL